MEWFSRANVLEILVSDFNLHDMIKILYLKPSNLCITCPSCDQTFTTLSNAPDNTLKRNKIHLSLENEHAQRDI